MWSFEALFDICDVVKEPTEIQILDRMTDILFENSSWCQSNLYVGDRARYQPQSGQRCLVGALNMADHGSACYYRVFANGGLDFRTNAAYQVFVELNLQARHPLVRVFKKLASGWYPIRGGNHASLFNDARGRRHGDVLDLITRARRSFSAACAIENVSRF